MPSASATRCIDISPTFCSPRSWARRATARLTPRGRVRFQLGDRDGMTYEFIGSITSGVAGGAFLYTNRESLSLGVIVQIASLTEQRVRAYELLERFKAHPTVAPLVRGTELVEYSAHMVPEAGLAMLPRLAGRGISAP